jgi:hypothetical protein
MSKAMRSIVVGGKTYRYRIGDQWCEIRWEGHKLAVPLHTLAGNTQDNIDHGRYERNRDGMITPKQVAGYIDRVISEVKRG